MGRLRDRRDRLEDCVTGAKRGESEEINKRWRRARNGKGKQ